MPIWNWIQELTRASNRRKRRRISDFANPAVVEVLEARVVLTTIVVPTVAANAYEEYTLQLINRARANPTAEAARLGISLNEGLPAGTISTSPEQPLALNPQLQAAIMGHLSDELAHNYFGHNGSNGSTFISRIEAAGYTNWTSLGENLAWQGTSGTVNLSSFTLQEYDNLFVDKAEPGKAHRIIFLYPTFKEAGVGEVTGRFQGDNSLLTGENFGVEPGNSILTGVVYNDKVATKFYAVGEGLSSVKVTVTGTTGTVYQTTTNAAGGYQIPLPAGTYTVTFSGANVPLPIVKSFTIGKLNVEVDANTRIDVGSAIPVVTLSPISQVVKNGTLVTFIAEAGGSPIPTVQWQVSTDGGKTYKNITGATSTTYQFKASSTQNGYQFRAVFTNSKGTATTKVAILKVA